MVFNRLGCAALLMVLLSACSLFESQNTRNEKRYDKYINQSRQAKVRRQNKAEKQEAAIPDAQAPPPRVDVTAGDAGEPVPAQAGEMPAPQPQQDAAPAPTP